MAYRIQDSSLGGEEYSFDRWVRACDDGAADILSSSLNGYRITLDCGAVEVP